MDYQIVTEIAKLLNLPPVIIAYLVWLGVAHFKKAKQLDIAFTKIRALQKRLENYD